MTIDRSLVQILFLWRFFSNHLQSDVEKNFLRQREFFACYKMRPNCSRWKPWDWQRVSILKPFVKNTVSKVDNSRKKLSKMFLLHIKCGQIAHIGNLELRLGSECQYWQSLSIESQPSASQVKTPAFITAQKTNLKKWKMWNRTIIISFNSAYNSHNRISHKSISAKAKAETQSNLWHW